MPNAPKMVLLNAERLQILRELALVDSDEETMYNQLTILASKILDAPVSLVSMVGADYQFFKSFVGLPEPWASRRRTPLSHSFCQHVVHSGEPLIVSDAREHDLVHDNKAIPDLNVIGYLGMPMTLRGGRTLGSFCVIDGEPRDWTETEIAIMRELSLIVIYEIELRAMVKRDASYQTHLDKAHEQIDQFIDNTNTEKVDQAKFLERVRDARETYFMLDNLNV